MLGIKGSSTTNLRAHPHIVHIIIDQDSLVEDNYIQDMWVGLLASSCTKDGKDEGNLIYIDLFSKLTSSEVRTLNYICENGIKN
ncbi:Abi-alpha family protein [Methanococcoides sp. FTZ1]|uniref:Abi-alpha family protein n=1 Tax=Methanococcoides sp. FTZ1 TaxID=3439061 RepID=UPI003F85C45F